MDKFYDKVIDFNATQAYPIFPNNIKELQRIQSVEHHYPFNFYNLNYIAGDSLHDKLVSKIDDLDALFKLLNTALNWYLTTCVTKNANYYLLLNGDSHPGNIIVSNNSKIFTMIDYYSDFLVITDSLIRVFSGYLGFLAKYNLLTKEHFNKINFPFKFEDLKDIELNSIQISDFSDQSILYSRDIHIKNILTNNKSNLSQVYEEVMEQIGFSIHEDFNNIKRIMKLNKH